jgi:hypothetical protein
MPVAMISLILAAEFSLWHSYRLLPIRSPENVERDLLFMYTILPSVLQTVTANGSSARYELFSIMSYILESKFLFNNEPEYRTIIQPKYINTGFQGADI